MMISRISCFTVQEAFCTYSENLENQAFLTNSIYGGPMEVNGCEDFDNRIHCAKLSKTTGRITVYIKY